MDKVKLDRIDWEQAKDACTNELRRSLLGVKINKKILETILNELKKLPANKSNQN